eukprot:1161452-Pelagomonas_calceolata.AAC.4
MQQRANAAPQHFPIELHLLSVLACLQRTKIARVKTNFHQVRVTSGTSTWHKAKDNRSRVKQWEVEQVEQWNRWRLNKRVSSEITPLQCGTRLTH